MQLNVNNTLGRSISTVFNIPEFIGIGDAGTEHQGSDQTEVGWRVNAMYELKHNDHGLSDFYTDYHWESLPWKGGNYTTRLMRKKSDNTWIITTGTNSLQYYTNPSKSITPPQTGWVVSTHGSSPVPKISSNAIIKTHDIVSVTNSTIVDNSIVDELTIRSDADSGVHNLMFGSNTLSNGDKYVAGYKLSSSGNPNGAISNISFAGINYVMSSAPIENVDESPNLRPHSFDQTVGKERNGNDHTPTSSGFQIQTYNEFFPLNATVTIKNLRVFKL